MAKPEKVAEKKFVRKVKRAGLLIIKLSTAGYYGSRGYNDRLVFAPFGLTVLFEFKREGKHAEKLQDYRHRKLRRLGHKTHVVYTCEEAWKILREEVRTKAVSVNGNKLRSREARGRILSGARVGKDNHNAYDLSHTKAARHRRRAGSAGEAAHRLRCMAERDKEVEEDQKVLVFDRAWRKEVEAALGTLRHQIDKLRWVKLAKKTKEVVQKGKAVDARMRRELEAATYKHR